MSAKDIRETLQGAGRSLTANFVAEKILEEHDFVQHSHGIVYEYDGVIWCEKRDDYMHHLALKADGIENTSQRRRGEIASYIKARVHDPNFTWGRVADYEVPCLDGVIDVRTGDMRSHRREDFLERVIPWPYDATAQCPAWQAALAYWFGDCEPTGELLALQEFFGYLLMPHARYKKAAFLYGAADTGKSQVLYTAEQLVGTAATCSLSVEDMDDPVRRAVVRGKALNVLSELSEDSLIRDSGFKTLISTEEPILINQKYKPAEMYQPTAKHIIAANVLPRITDRTEATFNRILLIPMTRIVADEDQDRDLKAKFRGDMPGVFAWAVEGANRLFEQRSNFTEPPLGAKILVEYRQEQNPVHAWLVAQTVRDLSAAVPVEEVTRSLNHFAATRYTRARVGRMLRSAGCAVKNVRQGERVLKCLIGRTLVRNDEQPALIPVDETAASSAAEEVDAAL